VNAQDVLLLDARIVQLISFPVLNVLENISIKMENAKNVSFHANLVLLQLLARNAVLATISKMEYAVFVPLDVRHVILKLPARNATRGIILKMKDVNHTVIQDISFVMGNVKLVDLFAFLVYLRHNV